MYLLCCSKMAQICLVRHIDIGCVCVNCICSDADSGTVRLKMFRYVGKRLQVSLVTKDGVKTGKTGSCYKLTGTVSYDSTNRRSNCCLP